MAEARQPGKKRTLAVPSVEEFHGNLQSLFPLVSTDGPPTVQFTEGAVVGLRQAYWTFLQHVAGNLAEHDSLDDMEQVAEALTLNDGIVGIVEQAQQMVTKMASQGKGKSAVNKTTTKKKLKRQKITADMEAQQEKLLQQSKASVLQQSQEKKPDQQS